MTEGVDLMHVLRAGKYTDDFWWGCTDYTLDGLWTMYKAYTKNITKKLYCGDIAPDFSLKKMSIGTYGKAVSLKDFRGKPVIVDFWGTWCGPCIEELPYLQKLLDKYGDKITVLTLSSDEAKVDQKFMDEHGYGFIDLSDPDYNVGQNLYQIQGWPSTFLIDSDGMIVCTDGVGEWNFNEYCQRIDDILNK